MNDMKYTADLKVGDTVAVWWNSAHGDRIVAIEPHVHTGPAEEAYFYAGAVILCFASGIGMTAFPTDAHEVIHTA